jgi:cell division protease FtsH
VVDWPDVRGREGILRVHTRKIPLADDVDLKYIARGTPGLAGADLANIVNEAALLAARRNRKKVTQRDFEDAKDKVMLGMERRSLVMTEEERRSTAYHEAGTRSSAGCCRAPDPVNKVTIIPRGRGPGHHLVGAAGGAPQPLEGRPRAHAGPHDGRARGGALVFNHLTTGAISDIEQATGDGAQHGVPYGMSEALGPLTFGKKEEMVFLGKEIATHKDYSEQTAVLIDQEVRRIIETSYNSRCSCCATTWTSSTCSRTRCSSARCWTVDEMDRVLHGEKLPPMRPAVEPETPEVAASTPEPKEAGEKLGPFPPPGHAPPGRRAAPWTTGEAHNAPPLMLFGCVVTFRLAGVRAPEPVSWRRGSRSLRARAVAERPAAVRQGLDQRGGLEALAALGAHRRHASLDRGHATVSA